MTVPVTAYCLSAFGTPHSHSPSLPHTHTPQEVFDLGCVVAALRLCLSPLTLHVTLLHPTPPPSHPPRPQDVFALGCVIAELWLGGDRAFLDLSRLLAYRRGEYDPGSALTGVEPDMSELIMHMVQRAPGGHVEVWVDGGGGDEAEKESVMWCDLV